MSLQREAPERVVPAGEMAAREGAGLANVDVGEARISGTRGAEVACDPEGSEREAAERVCSEWGGAIGRSLYGRKS
jgi:hypothetical protein